MYQPEQRVIRLRATGPNHQWAMEMMTECQIHHRDGRNWVVIQEKLNQHGLHVTIQEITFTKTQEKTEAKTMKDQLPDLKNPLPMPTVKIPKTEAIATNEIEKTKRALYGCLDRIRRAGKHRKLTAEFEERLEEHLEVLRQHENNLSRNCLAHLETAGQMRQERDQIQQRLHAIDHAYNEQQKAMGIAGEELIRVQGMARQYLDDCRSAEKLSDELDEKLRSAQAVIGQQEQLITGQRLAIADLYLAGRRVNSAVATLQSLGYTDCGGQQWKPPLGKRPHFDDEWCTDPRFAHCRAKAGGPGYPVYGASSGNYESGAGARPGVGAGGSGSGGGSGRATGR